MNMDIKQVTSGPFCTVQMMSEWFLDILRFIYSTYNCWEEIGRDMDTVWIDVPSLRFDWG